jgi:hypothetical protein
MKLARTPLAQDAIWQNMPMMDQEAQELSVEKHG